MARSRRFTRNGAAARPMPTSLAFGRPSQVMMTSSPAAARSNRSESLAFAVRTVAITPLSVATRDHRHKRRDASWGGCDLDFRDRTDLSRSNGRARPARRYSRNIPQLSSICDLLRSRVDPFLASVSEVVHGSWSRHAGAGEGGDRGALRGRDRDRLRHRRERIGDGPPVGVAACGDVRPW